MTTVAAGAFGERVGGERPSRAKALVASTAAGIGAAVLAYRFLRREPRSG